MHEIAQSVAPIPMTITDADRLRAADMVAESQVSAFAVELVELILTDVALWGWDAADAKWRPKLQAPAE